MQQRGIVQRIVGRLGIERPQDIPHGHFFLRLGDLPLEGLLDLLNVCRFWHTLPLLAQATTGETFTA